MNIIYAGESEGVWLSRIFCVLVVLTVVITALFFARLVIVPAYRRRGKLRRDTSLNKEGYELEGQAECTKNPGEEHDLALKMPLHEDEKEDLGLQNYTV